MDTAGHLRPPRSRRAVGTPWYGGSSTRGGFHRHAITSSTIRLRVDSLNHDRGGTPRTAADTGIASSRCASARGPRCVFMLAAWCWRRWVRLCHASSSNQLGKFGSRPPLSFGATAIICVPSSSEWSVPRCRINPVLTRLLPRAWARAAGNVPPEPPAGMLHGSWHIVASCFVAFLTSSTMSSSLSRRRAHRGSCRSSCGRSRGEEKSDVRVAAVSGSSSSNPDRLIAAESDRRP